MSIEIKEEVKILKEIGMLTEADTELHLIFGSYNYKNWSEFFWRRKKRHSSRPDPEIKFIQKSKPRSVLEIGSGYGRFTRKILEIDHSIEVTGLEINSSFQDYVSLYIQEYPILKKATFIYMNILDSREAFNDKQFDIIVIPMHTFPGFTLEFISNLFPILHSLLKKSGEIIFSTQKWEEIEKRKSILFEERYEGELLVVKHKNNISSHTYYFPSKIVDYGFKRNYYNLYTIFNDKFQILERNIVRNSRDFISKSSLLEIIRKNNFKVNYIETTKISDVYSLSSM